MLRAILRSSRVFTAVNIRSFVVRLCTLPMLAGENISMLSVFRASPTRCPHAVLPKDRNGPEH